MRARTRNQSQQNQTDTEDTTPQAPTNRSSQRVSDVDTDNLAAVLNELKQVARHSRLVLEDAVDHVTMATATLLEAMAEDRFRMGADLGSQVTALGHAPDPTMNVDRSVRRMLAAMKMRWHHGDDAQVVDDILELERANREAFQSVLANAQLTPRIRDLIRRIHAAIDDDCKALGQMSAKAQRARMVH